MKLQPGVYVRILPSNYYHGNFTDQKGVVSYMTGLCPDKIGVAIEGQVNSNSRHGVFWFDKHVLQIIESEDYKMLPNYTVANISFLSGSNTSCVYAYALYDSEIKENDVVVVRTGHHGFALAKVVEIAPKEHAPVMFNREIVSKVDFTAFDARCAKAQRLAELKKTMDAKVKELQEYALYELLSEKDPALREMLAEFKDLSAGGKV